MSTLLYAGFVAAGAVTLVIEAYRNFNSTSARHPFDLHPILKEVEVRNLCTTGEIIVGFSFYAFLYLIAYAVLLTSAEVYGLLARANSALGEIGATDTKVGAGDPTIAEVISFSSGDYNKPILISALIISSLTLGAVKPIETTMRALAHRLAGVPRGVYKVIENLKRIDYTTMMERHPKPLTTLFELVSRNHTEKSGIQAIWKEEIKEALASVDCLRFITYPRGRNLYFPLYDLARLNELSNKIKDRYDALETTIHSLSDLTSTAAKPASEQGSSDQTTEHATSKEGAETVNKKNSIEGRHQIDKTYRALGKQAQELSADMMACFAVLFIRNNRAIFSLPGRIQYSDAVSSEHTDPISEIRDKVFSPEKDEHNAFALSLIGAFIISYVCVLLLYFIWRYWTGLENREIYSDCLSKITAGTADVDKALACQNAVWEWLTGQFDIIFEVATADQLQTLLITAGAVLLVIIGRDVRMEAQSWRSGWSFHQFPFLRFLTMSLLSGLTAAFLTALVQSARLWWDVDFQLTESQIIGLFRDRGSFFALQVGSGIILAMTALAIMDKHQESQITMSRSLIIAALGGFIYYFYQWVTLFISTPFPANPSAAWFSHTTRDALIYSALPCSFLLLFSALLEISERNAQKDEQSRPRQGHAAQAYLEEMMNSPASEKPRSVAQDGVENPS